MGFLLRILICIFFGGLALYLYIDDLNELTEMRREIPELEKALRRIEEENARLAYEVDTFESPQHLMELLRQPEYGHLRHPELKDIIQLPTGVPIEAPEA